MIRRSPCYKCTEREIGCHAKCKLYYDYKAYLQTLKDKRDKELMVQDFIATSKERRRK